VEFAELYLVAVGQRRRLHGFVVDVGAVEAADICDLDVVVLQHPEFSVTPADGAIIRTTSLSG
jgi:hypothetical protein